MPVLTPTYGLSKPLVNNPVDQNLWGGEINADMDEIDLLLLTAINFQKSNQTTSFAVAAPTAVSGSTGGAHILFRCDATAGAMTATLPAAASAGNGFTVAFKKTDSGLNAVTTAAAGADRIDGAATLALANQYDYAVLVCDGVASWDVIGKASPGGVVQNFTPVLNFGGASTGITYAVQTGKCIQIGKNILVEIHFTLTSKGSANGSATIGGLPVAALSAAGACMIPFYSGMFNINTDLEGQVQGTNIFILMQQPTGMINATDGNFTNSAEIFFTCQYIGA